MKKMAFYSSSFFVLKRSILFHPWIYFAFFLTSLTFLSYCSLSLTVRLWLEIFGLAVPLCIALWTLVEEKYKYTVTFMPAYRPGLTHISSDDPPIWLWVLFIGLMFVMRFYKLTALPFWPQWDEDITATLALGLDHDWAKNLLFSEARLEPLFIWISAFLFNYLLPPSLWSIRLIPTFISITTVMAAYWVGRQFMAKRMSFVFAWLFGFSYFALTLSRLFLCITLAPLLQFLCLGLLALFLSSNSPRSRWIFLFILCLAASLGFYDAPTWPAVWLFLVAVLVWKTYQDPKNLVYLGIFLGGTLLLIYPIVKAQLTLSGMSHIRANFGGFIPWESIPTYGSVLLWNSKPIPPFSPNWGGFLNPLVGSLTLVGFLCFLRTYNYFQIALSILGFFLALLPAILSNSLEIYRISHAFPFLLASAALGIQGLALTLPKMTSWKWVTCLLLILLTLDANKYFVCFCGDENMPLGTTLQLRSVKYFQIYRFLRQKSFETGPLHVFTEFSLDYENKVINAAIYSFNILQNPALASANSQWTALLISNDEGPFLQKRFPDLEYIPFPQNAPLSLGLFLIPTREIPSSVLHSWIEADHVYRMANYKIVTSEKLSVWV